MHKLVGCWGKISNTSLPKVNHFMTAELIIIKKTFMKNLTSEFFKFIFFLRSIFNSVLF